MNKKEPSYDAAWVYCKDKLGPDFEPTEASGDFELAAANAAENNNPTLGMKYCYFHFTQCIIKNGQKRGLCRCYKENEEYNQWLRLILCVPLLPDYFITAAFTQLLLIDIKFENRADRENFGNFKRYIQKNWNDPEKMPPKNLSCFQREHTTNNGPENYNGFCKREIKQHHASFWIFIINYL